MTYDTFNSQFYISNDQFHWVNDSDNMTSQNPTLTIENGAILKLEQVQLSDLIHGKYYVLEFEIEGKRETLLRKIFKGENNFLMLCNNPKDDKDNLNFDTEQMQFFTRIFKVVSKILYT